MGTTSSSLPSYTDYYKVERPESDETPSNSTPSVARFMDQIKNRSTYFDVIPGDLMSMITQDFTDYNQIEQLMTHFPSHASNIAKNISRIECQGNRSMVGTTAEEMTEGNTLTAQEILFFPNISSLVYCLVNVSTNDELNRIAKLKNLRQIYLQVTGDLCYGKSPDPCGGFASLITSFFKTYLSKNRIYARAPPFIASDSVHSFDITDISIVCDDSGELPAFNYIGIMGGCLILSETSIRCFDQHPEILQTLNDFGVPINGIIFINKIPPRPTNDWLKNFNVYGFVLSTDRSAIESIIHQYITKDDQYLFAYMYNDGTLTSENFTEFLYDNQTLFTTPTAIYPHKINLVGDFGLMLASYYPLAKSVMFSGDLFEGLPVNIDFESLIRTGIKLYVEDIDASNIYAKQFYDLKKKYPAAIFDWNQEQLSAPVLQSR